MKRIKQVLDVCSESGQKVENEYGNRPMQTNIRGFAMICAGVEREKVDLRCEKGNRVKTN